MQKSLYVPDDDLTYWDEAARIAERRGLSVSKLISELLRNYVEQNHQGRDLGLPVGFAIPESMKDPRIVAAEQAADDIRARALQAILTAIPEEVSP